MSCCNNWDPDSEPEFQPKIPSVKIDHNFNRDSKLSGYWSVQDTTRSQAPTVCRFRSRAGAIRRSTATPSGSTSTRPFRRRSLLHLGAGYLRFHNPDSAPDDVINYDAVSGIGFNGASTDPSGFPRIVGPGLGNLVRATGVG